MKRIMIITHGTLCEGFLSAMEIINGNCSGIDVLSLHTEETIDQMTQKLRTRIDGYDPEDTVILLTDIAIGTTTKCIYPLMEHRTLYVICGLNLPLLLSVFLSDLGEDCYASLKLLTQESRDSILFINELLEQQKEGVETNDRSDQS